MRQQHERGENADATGTSDRGQKVGRHVYDGGYYEHRDIGHSAVYADRRGIPEARHVVRRYHEGYRGLAQVEKRDSSDFKRIHANKRKYPANIQRAFLFFGKV